MQTPTYVLTQDAQPGMLIEVEGERFMVQGVTVAFPLVRYATPRGTEAVEYGVQARIVTVSYHPGGPATTTQERTPAEAAQARTEVYVTAVREAIETPATDLSAYGLRQVCTECGEHVEAMTESERAAHVIVEPFERWIVVGCEGYWLVDPAAVGLDRGHWQDWRELHCGDCAATLAQHCPECNECPMTDGPCYCGSRSYASEGRPSAELTEVQQMVAEIDTAVERAAAPVWTPSTPDERRHVAVAELVAETMAAPADQRYARAYGILAGLVASGTGDINTRWAADFAREMNQALKLA
jgi:hypothetical protein